MSENRKTLVIGLLSTALLFASCTRDKPTPLPGIPVASVSLSSTQSELAVGEHQVLVATVLPEDATNKKVQWISDKPEVVRVDGSGELLALAAGEALITATTENGAKQAACAVVVEGDLALVVSVSGFPDLSGSIDVPYNRLFDNIKADISGDGAEIIATLEGVVADGKVTLTLPAELPADRLCKVARESWNDYEGFWPAEGVSDRTAKVACVGDIVAYRGDTPVGRIFLSDWNGTLEGRADAAYLYFHYADRPVELSGYNLTRPPKPPMESNVRKSFRYAASFVAGWNVYCNIENGTGPSLCTTTLPEPSTLRWHFEPWP